MSVHEAAERPDFAFLWNEMKLFAERSSSFSSDSLHLILSVAILFAAALIMKRPLSSWRPWLLLLVVAMINEITDLWVDQWPHAGMQYGESAKDLLLTMALPTVLLFTARFLPQLYEPGRSKRSSQDDKET